MSKQPSLIYRGVLFVVDIFYPLLKKVLPKQIYRFLAVGGICFAINIIVFHVSFYYLYLPLNIGLRNIPPYMLAFFTSLSITVLLGFYLNKEFVFNGSVLEKHVQFVRFCYSTILEAIASYLLLRFFVEQLGWHPTLSLIFNVMIIQTANFFIQRDYSFKK